MLKRKKWLAFLMTVCMMLTAVPVGAFADTGTWDERTLVCGLEESAGHTHDESCICLGGELICGLEEGGHIHNDACYTEEQQMSCTSEDDGHEHAAECYTTEKVLNCELEETEHVHSDACYCQGGEHICELEESEGHTHKVSCYLNTENELQNNDVTTFATDTATVYFGNDLSANTNARYAAVSFRQVGESQWTYSRYFAPLAYNDCSEAFQLLPGSYEFVMNVAFKDNVSAITGTFTVTKQLAVEDLVTDAQGAEIQQQGKEYMIVAGNQLAETTGSYSRKFFKVLQPSGLTSVQVGSAVSFYREDGTKMGVYNYSSNGTVTILLPKKIVIGAETVSQSIYYYEVSVPGYQTAKGSCTVNYEWQEDENFKAEKIENSPTLGYQVYLAPASSTSTPISFSVVAGDQNAEVSVMSSDGTEITVDENGLFQIPIPDTGKVDYTYTVSCEAYVDFTGSFVIDTDGNVTDTTTETQKEAAITYEFSNGTMQIQMQPRITITAEDIQTDGYYYKDIAAQFLQTSDLYPGNTQTGKFTIENDTDQDLYIVDYDINLKDENGKYTISRLMRCANEPIRALYGWDQAQNEDHDESSTLTDIVYVDEKIKEVYQNSEDYIAKVSGSYEESEYFTYPAYLLYYFKTTYPEKYSDITALSQLDDAAIVIIMNHFNGKSDQWYNGEEFRQYGPGFNDAGEIEEALQNQMIYEKNSGVGYAAVEVYDEVDELLKVFLFRNGFFFSLDTEVCGAKQAPSLYDWSNHEENAQAHFEEVLEKGNVLTKAQEAQVIKSGESSSMSFPNIAMYLAGGAFPNITQQATWSFQINVVLSNTNEPPEDASKIGIAPADIIIYMGGKSYDGVSTENGTIVTDSSGLPEPGFKITLPDALKNISIENDLILQYKESSGTVLQWKFEPYGVGSTDIFRIVPGNDTTRRDVRINFTNAKGEVITDDMFDITKNLNQTLHMEVYGEGIDKGLVSFVSGNQEYGIAVGEATIEVLGTTDQVKYGNAVASVSAVVAEQPGLVAPVGTIYTINDTTIQVDTKKGQVALLFDHIIDTNMAEKSNTELLKAKAEEVLPSTSKTRYYDFKYLDLVDRNNGNVWVMAKDAQGDPQDVTVYWPLPDGTDKNTNFTLLHYKNLHRDMTTGQIADDIMTCDVETVTIQEVTDTHVVFNVGSGGFSPFVLVWEKTDSGSSGGGGGSSTKYYTLHYESNGGTEYDDERYKKNTVVDLDKVPVRMGYTFTGWYADEELAEKITEIKMTSDKTVYAGWVKSTVPDQLNGDDHFAYVVGYPDGSVQPNGNITRAEVAAIFFRLLQPEVRDGNLSDTNVFTDVTENDWHNVSVSTMAELNIIKGRTETTFVPDAPITRAEFAAICARFDTGLTEGDSNLTDISGHWAEEEIERAVSLGWIAGYPDGTFKPNQFITRAEAVSIINRVLCRMPEEPEDLLSGMNIWPDNMDTNKWYYLAVQEATNSHTYEHKGEIYETWLELTADPDWSRYNNI